MAIWQRNRRADRYLPDDEHGTRCSRRPGDQAPRTDCWEYTSSTVTVRFGSIIYTYDEHGMTIYAKAASPITSSSAVYRAVAVPDGMPEVRSRRISVTRLLPRRWMASTVCHPARAYTRSASVVWSRTVPTPADRHATSTAWIRWMT